MLSFLRDAELALQREKFCTMDRGKWAVKAVEARELAAMIRGIYWPYEVAKMKERMREKEENTCEV